MHLDFLSRNGYQFHYRELNGSVGTMEFIPMGVWAIFLSKSLYKNGIIKVWFLTISIASEIGIKAGIFEWEVWKAAPEINAIAYQIWIVLLIILRVLFIVRRRQIEMK